MHHWRTVFVILDEMGCGADTERLSKVNHFIMTSTTRFRPAIRPVQPNVIDLGSHNNVIHDMQCDDFVVYCVDPSRRPVIVHNGSPGVGMIRFLSNAL